MKINNWFLKEVAKVSINIMRVFSLMTNIISNLSDKKEIYHSESNINYAWNGTFSTNKLEDQDVISLLINKINNIGK